MAGRAGHRNEVAIALGPAATSFFEDGRYVLAGAGRVLETEAMIDY